MIRRVCGMLVTNPCRISTLFIDGYNSKIISNHDILYIVTLFFLLGHFVSVIIQPHNTIFPFDFREKLRTEVGVWRLVIHFVLPYRYHPYVVISHCLQPFVLSFSMPRVMFLCLVIHCLILLLLRTPSLEIGYIRDAGVTPHLKPLHSAHRVCSLC